jgi:hypothetical protein
MPPVLLSPFMPGLAFHFLLVGCLLQTGWSQGQRPRVLTAAAGLAAAAVGLLPAANAQLIPKRLLSPFYFRYGIRYHHTEYEYWRFMRKNVARWTREGKAVAAYAPPQASYTAGAIGASGYYSGRRLYDRCGLVDREVARLPVTRLSTPGHDKCQPAEFFLPREPDLLYVISADRGELRTYAHKLKARDFSDRYVADFTPLPEPALAGEGQYLFVCRRLSPGEDAAAAWAEADRRLDDLAGQGR